MFIPACAKGPWMAYRFRLMKTEELGKYLSGQSACCVSPRNRVKIPSTGKFPPAPDGNKYRDPQLDISQRVRPWNTQL